MIRPTNNENQFVNRHGRHSINAMVVCGPDYKIYCTSAKWPGAVSDARVLRNSHLAQQLRDGWRPFPGAVLLGDSGYWNDDFLITPLLNPQTEQEQRFNNAHKKTRNLVECTIGILKQRFRCLLRTLQVQPTFAANIFRCCSVLHNISINDQPIAFDDEVYMEANAEDVDEEMLGNREGNIRRRQLISLF